MYRSYEEKVLIIARRLVYAFYVDRDIDTIISYLNPKDFMYTCANTNQTIIGAENMRDFLRRSLHYLDGYKIIKENYQFCSSSIDSCLISADLETQAVKYNLPYITSIKVLFQFKLVEEKLLVSYYQVLIPLKNSTSEDEVFLPTNKMPVEMHIDRQYHYTMLENLMAGNSASIKVVYCEENFPYHYVNLKFLKLLNCPCIKDFVAENKSSIEHIFPADQKRYSDFVTSHVKESLKNVSPGKIWQWRDSYYIIYRTFNRENFYVLEWGNLFTLDNSPMIMAMVLPLQDISIFYGLSNKIPEGFSRFNTPPP